MAGMYTVRAAVLTLMVLLFACAPASSPSQSGPAGGASGPAAAPLATSGSASTTAGQPRRGGTLVVGQDVVPNGLDPHLLTATPFVSQMIYEHIYSGLLRLDAELQPQADLAERWDTNDHQTFVFHLRHGVKFHHGRDMTADDVVYSLARLADPAKNDRPRSWLRDAAVQAPDAYTVQVVLPRPDAAFLVRLAHPDSAIVPRDVVEQHGNLQQVAVGTGPFRLVEEVPGVQIRLERNAQYYLPERPYLDAIVFKMITDEPTRLANIRSGDVAATRLYDPKNARVLASNTDVAVVEGPSLTRDLLFLNTARPPLNDVRVRQAISLALNRDEIVKGAVFGAGSMVGSIPPALRDWALPVSALPYSQHDPARARDLLAAAGVAGSVRLGVKASPNYPQDIAAAQIIQSQLKAVGIEVEVLPLEWGALNQDVRKPDFDLAIHPLLSESDPDAYFSPIYKSGNLLNYSRYTNPRVDALIDRGVTTADKAQRKATYEELQRLVDEEATDVALFSQNRIDVLRKAVKGYVQLPNGSRTFYRDTWLER
jgi:peptide/nickel transport system substrate-binding protein